MMNSIAIAVLGVFTAAGPEVSFTAPSFYVQGEPYVVEVTYTAGGEDTTLETWQFGPAMFEVDGQPLAERTSAGQVPLGAGASITIELDLKNDLVLGQAFKLGVTGAAGAAIEVGVFEGAPEGLDFLTLPQDQLADYRVLLRTNQGSMLLEFWPDLAPNHVRNFLELSYTGFYDGIQFHRVSPTFMIQGGCPETKTPNQSRWGTGRGPRMLDAEFSDTLHERGVLSMARSSSPNSASSQFFVMTARSTALDNKYSVFGQMVSGDPTLTKISNAPGKAARDGTIRPSEPQRIEQARVLKPVQ
jgi:cyclophilin family peptidyl-prolyl cis-trans isomerase